MMNESYSFIKNLNLKYNDSVVVGVSGGPDSMVLLYLLIKLKKSMDIQIICAHVNHNVRKESVDEEKFVCEYCRQNGVIFESMTIENYGDDNFHNEARTIRYNYFEKLVLKYHAKYLFTAHHGDDLMETILMRITRGSTLRGYSGFSRIINRDGYKIVRPLINLTKDEIANFANQNNIKYVIDSSNLKDKYTRNRYRKYVLPQLKKESPNVHLKFYKFSQTLLEYDDYVSKQTEKIINKVCPQNILNIEEFLKLEHIIQMKIIYHMLENIYQDDLMLITNRHTNLIYNLILSDKTDTEIHLPNNIAGVKSYNNFFLQPITNTDAYEIEISTYVNLPNGKNIEVVKASDSDGNDICRLNTKELTLPLYVRTRRDGDKMAVKGMLGSKKINDIFTDCKVNMNNRKMWPVVMDSADNIVWLPGLKKSKFNKTKDEKYDIILKYY